MYHICSSRQARSCAPQCAVKTAGKEAAFDAGMLEVVGELYLDVLHNYLINISRATVSKL